jgi:hypothetical protein
VYLTGVPIRSLFYYLLLLVKKDESTRERFAKDGTDYSSFNIRPPQIDIFQKAQFFSYLFARVRGGDSAGFVA